MELLIFSLLGGVSYGMLLFMLSSGLTLVFSMMGVLNFAHASLYMLGAYLGYALHGAWGFTAAVLLAPLLVGLLGGLLEYGVLRRVHAHGHVAELLMTFGFSYVLVELIQLFWGRSPLPAAAPSWLQSPLLTLVHSGPDTTQWAWGDAARSTCAALPGQCMSIPQSRAWVMVVAGLMLGLSWALLRFTRVGLVIRAAMTHPAMARALGHDVDRVYALVFAAGSALAGLAGVFGGSIFVTEPGMAASVGSLLFVVIVVGGLGSLGGAFVASLLLGVLQTLAVSFDRPVAGVSLAQLAPVLPFVLLVAMLLLRPQGLGGARAA